MQRIVIVVFDGLQQLDATGPFEVLRAGGYEVELASMTGRSVTSESGLRLGVDRCLPALRGPLDTLLVAGGSGVDTAVCDAALVQCIRGLASRARRVASVCSGALLLAEAGLLDGRRATTHWQRCEALSSKYPHVTVDPEPIFVRDGNVWTSAGVTAGMDLALALVEEDRGRDVALAIARHLVMYVQRPGGQAQFSAALRAQRAERQPLRDVQAWVTDHLDDDLSVERLARLAHMSPRHFSRAFAAETGLTPARYVATIRVEAARRLLESTTRSIDDVAATCGLRSAETLRRALLRSIHVSPGEYRRRSNKEATA